MSTFKLYHETCLNPYFINGAQVLNIRFIQGGAVLCSTNRGWIAGNNNKGCDVVEEMEFKRKRKVDLSADYPFFATTTTGREGLGSKQGVDLYIPVSLLPDFVDHGEELAMEGDERIYYGHFISFEFESKQGLAAKYEHLQGVKSHKIMVGHYTRSENTPRGDKIEAILDLFGDSGARITSHQAGKLLDNKEAVIKMLGGEL